MFFNHMILALDEQFVHRARNPEGKERNPLNEVRLLSNSLMNGGGVLTAEKVIKMDLAKSVLQLQFGDPIQLNKTDFARLSEAFFAELENRYAE